MQNTPFTVLGLIHRAGSGQIAKLHWPWESDMIKRSDTINVQRGIELVFIFKLILTANVLGGAVATCTFCAYSA